MWIKILIFIFMFIFILILIYSSYINMKISNSLNDIPLLLNNSVPCIHIKNFYPIEYCDKILNRINNIQSNNIKPWRYSNNKIHDVSIFQTPLSDVLNELVSPEDYFNQSDWKLYNNIISPIDYFISKSNIDYIKKSRDDCIIAKFPQYSKYSNKFLDSLIRIYKPNTYSKEGLKHVDIDDTGYYHNYNIYTINIYLKIPTDGGNLNINNKSIRPSKGDLILFNPSYYHSVSQSQKEDRISVQSFILSHKHTREIFIRV
jgi:hypothetical protein